MPLASMMSTRVCLRGQLSSCTSPSSSTSTVAASAASSSLTSTGAWSANGSPASELKTSAWVRLRGTPSRASASCTRSMNGLGPHMNAS
ncbi:Uncharacterised protein [Mycobacteroides abscessus subsp. abscessus]|nr:Uncharacterised protein [Mycobacteroides abscessus subsp. abscessus]